MKKNITSRRRFNLPHERIDRRNLTVSRLVARAIEKDPNKEEEFKKALNRIIESEKKNMHSGVDLIWKHLLQEGDWRQIRHFLVASCGDKETQLRQGIPFVRVLPKKTIQKVYRKYKLPKSESLGVCKELLH